MMFFRAFTVLLSLTLVLSLVPRHPARADDGFPPDYPKRILFIHHSSGMHWKEDFLDAELQAAGFAPHYATYYWQYNWLDDIAELTDVNHWYPKFSTVLGEIVTFDKSVNQYYADSTENQIIMFKSCFPASDVVDLGTEPGDPEAPEKTVANYKAAFTACAAIFAEYPEKLFVPLTTLPRSYWDEYTDPEARMWMTRQFNDWLTADFVTWYESTYGLKNVFVFDAFDVLADGPEGDHPDYLRVAFLNSPDDSHPSEAGNYALTYGYTDPDDGRAIPGMMEQLPAAVDHWLASLTRTVSASLTCAPSSGTLPFASTMVIRLGNEAGHQIRRIAGRLDLDLAGGMHVGGWKQGWRNLIPGEHYIVGWNQHLPALGSLVGDSVLRLVAVDVTPAPYNQPPYSPSGSSDQDSCTLTGAAP